MSSTEPPLELERLGDITRRMLESAGWCPSHRLDVDAVLAVLSPYAPSIPARTLHFLERYGGLEVSPATADGSFFRLLFHTDPERAVAMISPGTAAAFSALVGRPLVPIGGAHDGELVLLMDDLERTFAADGDDRLYFVASSGAGLLDAFCIGAPLRPVTAER